MKSNKNILIIGNFGNSNKNQNGQIIKTRIVYDYLSTVYKDRKIIKVNTYNWKIKNLIIVSEIIIKYFYVEQIIILISRNGMKIIFPILNCLKKLRNKDIHHLVIGSGIYNLIKNNLKLVNILKNIKGNYLETKQSIEELEDIGFDNLYYTPNFKILEKYNINNKNIMQKVPFKICTFSRVMKEKGIEDAIKFVIEYNESKNSVCYTLDIYGPIDKAYEIEFREVVKNLPQYISYKGVVDYDKSVEILSKYYFMLFLTKYDIEGVPGTIIDAYFSGLPVITTNWRCSNELIFENVTGWIVKKDCKGKILALFEILYKNPQIIANMRKNCLLEAKKYYPENALRYLVNNIIK